MYYVNKLTADVKGSFGLVVILTNRNKIVDSAIRGEVVKTIPHPIFYVIIM